jgi:hypothetical protein
MVLNHRPYMEKKTCHRNCGFSHPNLRLFFIGAFSLVPSHLEVPGGNGHPSWNGHHLQGTMPCKIRTMRYYHNYVLIIHDMIYIYIYCINVDIDIVYDSLHDPRVIWYTRLFGWLTSSWVATVATHKTPFPNCGLWTGRRVKPQTDPDRASMDETGTLTNINDVPSSKLLY